MKLIKLSEEHYIVMDESLQPVEGLYYDTFVKAIRNTSGAEYGECNHCWQITHSTQPLEQKTNSYSHGFNMKSMSSDVELVFDKIKPLSLSEVEEAINGYSVEKMAENEANKITFLEFNKRDKLIQHKYYKEGFIKGFNAHKELMKDKLLKLIEELNIKAKSFIPAHVATNYYKQIEILKSLLPKTEWDVEFVDGKLKLV